MTIQPTYIAHYTANLQVIMLIKGTLYKNMKKEKEKRTRPAINKKNKLLWQPGQIYVEGCRDCLPCLIFFF
jgi:hypothetical protein